VVSGLSKATVLMAVMLRGRALRKNLRATQKEQVQLRWVEFLLDLVLKAPLSLQEYLAVVLNATVHLKKTRKMKQG